MSCSLHISPFHGWGNSRTFMSHSCMIYLSWSRWHASEWMGTRLSFWTLTGCLPYLSHIWTAGLDKDRMLTRGTMVLTWGCLPFAFEHSKLKGLACRQLCQVILFQAVHGGMEQAKGSVQFPCRNGWLDLAGARLYRQRDWRWNCTFLYMAIVGRQHWTGRCG